MDNLIRKGMIPSEMSFVPAERAAIFKISTGSVDRDHEIIMPMGINYDEYMQNPVVLWGHDYRSLPVGKCISLMADENGLIGKVKFANTPAADEIYQYLKDGGTLGASIGFSPLEFEDVDEELDGVKICRRYTKIKMLEWSLVTVPANQDALLLAVSKSAIPYGETPKADEGMAWDAAAEVGKADSATLKIICAWYDSANPDLKGSYKLPHHHANSPHSVVWEGVNSAMGALLGARGGVDIPSTDRKGVYGHLAKHYKQFDKPVPDFKEVAEEEMVEKLWDDAPSEIRFRIRDPKLFQSDSFRTIPIKRDSPKINAIAGKLTGESTMTLQALRFPKDEGWDMGKAKTWVADHPDIKKEFSDYDENEVIETITIISEDEKLFDTLLKSQPEVMGKLKQMLTKDDTVNIQYQKLAGSIEDLMDFIKKSL